MGLLTFFGCLLTAYVPIIVFYVLYVGRNAQLLILFVSRSAQRDSACHVSIRLTVTLERRLPGCTAPVPSAFFWLLAMLFSSVWWIIIPPMKNVAAFSIIFSVLFQELFRWLFVLVLKCVPPQQAAPCCAAAASLTALCLTCVSGVLQAVGKGADRRRTLSKQAAVERNGPCHRYACPHIRLMQLDRKAATDAFAFPLGRAMFTAAGLGFGAMSSLISYIAVLAETTGPGLLYAPTCPGLSLSYILGRLSAGGRAPCIIACADHLRLPFASAFDCNSADHHVLLDAQRCVDGHRC